MAIAIAASAALLAGGHGAAAQDAPCYGPAVAQGIVASVADGRTLTLEDGREIRLAAIAVPEVGDEAETARQALARIVGEQSVAISPSGRGEDRYGRLVGYATAGPNLVQDALLAAGHARLTPNVTDAACAPHLRAIEKAARASGRGFWAGAAFAPRNADKPADIRHDLGRLTLVRGKVLSVRERGATIFVNFGRQWSRDFSVTIQKRNRTGLAAAGLDPGNWLNREVEVRGIVEDRGGPAIEVARPEQIEFVN